MIRVMLVSKFVDSVEWMKHMLAADKEIKIVESDSEKVVNTSADNEKLKDAIEFLDPNVVLLLLNGGDTSILKVAQRVVMYKPRTSVVLIVEELHNDIYKEAFKMGIRNIIEVTQKPEVLSEALHSIYETDSYRFDSIISGNSTTWSAKVVAVYGAKDGVGSSTIAVNLAMKLANEKKKVALLDYDLEFGDIALMLNLNPKDTIVELLQDKENPTMDEIKGFLTIHKSGIDVLCGPRSPEYAEIVTAEYMVKIIETMRSNYDYIVIDMGSSLTHDKADVLTTARYILTVLTLDLAVLKNTKLAITIFEALGLKGKIRIIINKFSKGTTIGERDVPSIVGSNVWLVAPNDPKSSELALNSGSPLMESASKSELAHVISLMCKKITDGEEAMLDGEAKRKKGFFRKRG